MQALYGVCSNSPSPNVPDGTLSAVRSPARTYDVAVGGSAGTAPAARSIMI